MLGKQPGKCSGQSVIDRKFDFRFRLIAFFLLMSESRSPNDEGSPSSSSRFELAMLESSGPLLDFCTKETLDDLHNCQTLANIGSCSSMLMGEGVMRPVKACPGYAECACRSERERIVFVTRGNIKLSGRELADVEKVLRVPKDDRHLGKLRSLFRKYGFQPLVYVNNCLAGRRSTVDELGEPLDENESDRDRMMRLSSYVMIEYDDRLQEVERYKAKFKENKQLMNDARKTSKALAKAICLKDQNFESLKKRNGENVRLKKQLEATKKQLETNILEVSKVKEELDSALVEVSGEFLGSQAFHNAFKPHCIQAANFEKRKWMVILERYDNGSIIQKYRDEMDEYRQRGEAFILAVDLSSEDDSDNEASVGDSGDTEDGGDGDAVETVSLLVIVLQVISIPWMAKGLAIGAPELFWTRNIACSSSTGTMTSVPKASENGVSPVEVRYEVQYDQRTWVDVELRAEHPELLVVELSPIISDYRIGNAKSAKDVLPYEVFYFCLGTGCQGFYFGPLCEVVNCNDCIADLALPCRHWADQIKSLLGERPRADHRSEGLRRGVKNSCIALTLIT
ncbi:GRIP domain-containing protein RUD3-like [Pyrus ussuriensis x Pyrus communis]|uniref:GRIP domain-containing protein RUD3-like n=1 Tax=Pyrus ussuriensis x Pyrus communis TaxID=2448454 RepID=A0A5N5FSF0_9ROSA|nr:GRIP domain-containing protein RUD3-like [Pyrus ussuriensis x Pyrus communis]